MRDRIVAETHGNPLALLELPRGLSHAQLAGGFGVPDPGGLSSRIEEGFLRRSRAFPAATQLGCCWSRRIPPVMRTFSGALLARLGSAWMRMSSPPRRTG